MSRLLVAVAVAALAAAGLAAPDHASAAASSSPPVYTLHTVGPYGGEPSIGTDANGDLFSTYLNGKDSNKQPYPNIFRSRDNGTHWNAVTTADPMTGDDCLGFDQSGAVYWCNLAGTPSKTPLQADVWKSVDSGKTWTYGQNPVNSQTGQNVCGTSCQPFGVDRQWTDGYIAPGGTTDNATVVVMYHDFYGPSQIWVNVSNDGGKTYAMSSDVLANLKTSGSQAEVIAQADSACNTIPAAIKIAKAGPHAGRIYVAWIAADPISLGSGCNVSQGQAYHNLIVAWSDDGGLTWTPQVAFDAGEFHDASSPFAAFTLDDQGNPYFGFVNNLTWDPTCAVPANPGTANCEVDMYVVWSADGGKTWQPGNGAGNGAAAATVPGSASSALKVNTSPGTHWFPAIAAGDPGKVDVAWLETETVVPSAANGKQWPGGCYMASMPNCKATTAWKAWAAQSLDLLSGTTPNQNPTWSYSQLTQAPMHVGDICNLGIACPPGLSNRNLADFISATLDKTGCAHVNFADDATNNAVMTADQIGGLCARGVVAPAATASPTAAASPSPSPSPTVAPSPSPSPVPKAPLPLTSLSRGLAPLLPMVIGLAALFPLLSRRRRTG